MSAVGLGRKHATVPKREGTAIHYEDYSKEQVSVCRVLSSTTSSALGPVSIAIGSAFSTSVGWILPWTLCVAVGRRAAVEGLLRATVLITVVPRSGGAKRGSWKSKKMHLVISPFTWSVSPFSVDRRPGIKPPTTLTVESRARSTKALDYDVLCATTPPRTATST